MTMPAASAPTVTDVDGLTVTVDVTNTGSRTRGRGRPAVRPRRRGVVPRPEKELKGFAKVRLEPVRRGPSTSASSHEHSRSGMCAAMRG